MAAEDGKFFYASFPLESQFLILRTDFDLVARFELTGQQLRRERVKQMFLDRALERTRAKLRVVAFAGKQLLRVSIPRQA